MASYNFWSNKYCYTSYTLYIHMNYCIYIYIAYALYIYMYVCVCACFHHLELEPLIWIKHYGNGRPVPAILLVRPGYFPSHLMTRRIEFVSPRLLPPLQPPECTDDIGSSFAASWLPSPGISDSEENQRTLQESDVSPPKKNRAEFTFFSSDPHRQL